MTRTIEVSSAAELSAALGAVGGDVEVLLADGVYRLAEPLVLKGAKRVSVRAVPGARPVVSGGLVLGGWSVTPEGWWRASVPESAGTPRQLSVNGARSAWARGPWISSADCSVTSAGLSGTEVAGWSRPEDVEAVFKVRWRDFHCRVASASPDLLTFVTPAWTNSIAGTGRVGPHWDDTAVTTMRHQWSMFLSNALELLREPGSFVWDSRARTVTYLPRPGEVLAEAEIVVPVLEYLVVVEGASQVSLRGITFRDTAWRQPGTDDGYAGMQAGLSLVGATGPSDMAGRFYTKPAAAVTVRNGHEVEIVECCFTGLGGAGAVLERGTTDSLISGCRFTDISGGAVLVGDLDPHPDESQADARNTVTLNTIVGVGVEFTDSVGIWAGYTRELTVSQNTLEDLPYSGISVGWGWNQPEAQDPWLGENTIRGNRLVGVMRRESRHFDGGAIYTQGPQPGTVIAANYINGVRHPSSGTDGNGVYLDEQSSYITVTGNVATRLGYKWVSNWAEYGVENRAVGNWTDSTVTPPLSGEGSVMRDNSIGLTELPPEAIAVAERAGAGPWPAEVDLL
ncbi:right-handed parallel beta-helix repeat-containing protein [Catenulispora subtropica]|uniref:Right handed beta helix domain-containing protein n=1 Tax=Catenulispora subtropica TaxID=450798 RepID=A0ABN2STX6_9ACTN